MSRIGPLVIALAVVCVVGVNEAHADQVFLNPGFETGSLAPWTIAAGAPFVTSAEAHSGTFSVAALGSHAIRQNFAAIPVTDITELSVWIKRAGGAFNSVRFFYDDASTGSTLINNIGGGNGWIQFNLTSFLNSAKNLNGFRIFGTSPGPSFMDDFVLDANIPEPASLAMLALASVCLLRRRRS